MYSYTRVTTVSNGNGVSPKSPIDTLPAYSPGTYSSVYRSPFRNSASSLNSSSTSTSNTKPGEDKARSGGNMATYNSTSSYNRTYEKKVIEEGNPHVRVTTQTTTPISASGLPDLERIHQSTLSDNMMSQFPSMSIGTSSIAHSTSVASILAIRVSNTTFHAMLDVKRFDADTLKVTVVDNHVIIEGRHGEKEEAYGSIELSFKRKLPLPKAVPADSVQSQLTADGVLVIDAKVPEPKANEGARPIQIKVQKK